MRAALLERRVPAAGDDPPEQAASSAVRPLRLALEVEDETLAARLALLLASVPGLVLAGEGEAADAVLASPERLAPASAEAEEALTPREREVLALLSEGASNKLIARRLGISVHTAKFHVGQLIDKLDATGRTDALAHAVRLGLIHL